jgi:hypothetical protein
VEQNRFNFDSFNDALTGPSGGLWYHATAFRRRRTLWTPYLQAVKNWLVNDWKPTSEELVIFGPSAGWSLPQEFLNKFHRVICVEPDPVARWIFGRRFSCQRLELRSDNDLLPWFTADPQRFSDFLATVPKAAILFSNLLGQIPLLLRGEALSESYQARAQKIFFEGLKGRNWASYHDLISCKEDSLIHDNKTFEKLPSVAELGEMYFPDGSTIIDHDTTWISNARPTTCAIWQIRPHQSHVVAFVQS